MSEIYVRNNNSWKEGTSGKIYLCTYGKDLMDGEGKDTYKVDSKSDGSGVTSKIRIIPGYKEAGTANGELYRLLTRGFSVGGIKIKISFHYDATNLKFSSSSSGNHRFGYEVAYKPANSSTYNYYGAWINKGTNGFTNFDTAYTKEGTFSNEISFSRGSRQAQWDDVAEGWFYL